MNGHISQWGNSLGIRIPIKIAEHLGIRAGSDVEITVEKSRIVLTPSNRLKLADLLVDYPAEAEKEIGVGKEQGAEQGQW